MVYSQPLLNLSLGLSLISSVVYVFVEPSIDVGWCALTPYHHTRRHILFLFGLLLLLLLSPITASLLSGTNNPNASSSSRF